MFDISSRVVELLGVGLTQSGQASLASDSDLTSAGTRVVLGSASLSAESSFTSDGLRKAFSAADLSAESTMAAVAVGTLFVSMVAEFDSTLSGAANATFRSLSASLASQMSMSASGAILYGGIANLITDSGMTGTGQRIAYGISSLTADTSNTGEAIRTTYATVALVSDVTVNLSSAPVKIRYGGSALEGDLATMEGTAFIRLFGGSTMSAAVASFTATPSTVYRLIMSSTKRAITDDYLLKRYPIDVGLSLLVKDGVVTEVEVPSQTELAEADYYFLGGMSNPITPAQRATLIAAGYGSYIQEG